MDAGSLWIAGAFAAVALVFASVGQAGASGYLAVMAFADLAPVTMKATALALNLVVAAICLGQFARRGHLTWASAWPFAVLSFPFSLAGGAVHLPETVYLPLVGTVLILSALQMARAAWRGRAQAAEPPRTPPFAAALLVGAAIGFLSGTTGTGGGVFLAPAILALNWATVRQTAAISAVFNLTNSAAALIGAHGAWSGLPPALPLWLVAVAIGGAAGAFVGARHLPEVGMRLTLAGLLLLSGLKLLVG